MSTHYKYIFSTIILSLACSVLRAQTEEEDKLNGGTITVVKAYDPSVADAFKVKSVPQLNDTTKLKKKAVTYSIFSVPVASTFTPAKGKLSRLKPRQRPEYFDNYARLGLGNYGNILAEFAGNLEIDKNSDFGIFLNHNSSFGGLDEVVVDDSFLDTALDLSYGHRSRYASYSMTAGARYQGANLYGIYEPLRLQLVGTDPDDTDVGVNYLSYGVGGNLDIFDSIFKDVRAKFTGITSNREGQELRAQVGTNLGFTIEEATIDLGVSIDYLNGSFEQQGRLPAQSEYAYASAGLSPTLKLYGDNYKIKLGATINYLNDVENSDSQFNIYPNIVATYKLLDDQVVAFTTIYGGLDLNSLQQFADDNVFLAPAINILPTDRVIDAQLGIKGKLSNTLGYKVYGGYKKENDRSFFIKDTGRLLAAQAPADVLGNVFFTSYGDLSTVSYGASLGFDISDMFNLALNAQGYSYDVSNGDGFLNTASQLPEFTADLVGTYQITDKIDVGATLYFVGEREVFRSGAGIESLDSFMDLNLDVNYRINPRLTAFLRGNNLTGGNYEYFLDYPVQDLQIMGGVVYKFDFQ